MKSFKRLFPHIVSFENVYSAYLKARKGKRYRDYTLSFIDAAEYEIWSIIADLRGKTYRPGTYNTFMVYEPKERLICAAPFRDRVVHHALCNVIEPLYDRTFIHDSYACRKGKGTHRAIYRAWEFMRKNKYVLKCDVRKFFSSIDHNFVKSIVRNKMRCTDTLWLLESIIDHGNEVSDTQGVGLPIGNLTSQFLANLYLNELDYFVKKSFLNDCKADIYEFLGTMKLELKPGKSEIFPVKNGFEFLGFYHRSDRVRVKKDGVRRFQRRIREMRWMYYNGMVSLDKIGESIRCWSAHAAYADSYRLRRNLLRCYAV